MTVDLVHAISYSSEKIGLTPLFVQPALPLHSHFKSMRMLDKKIPAPVSAMIIGALMKWYAHLSDIQIDPSTIRMEIGIGLS